MRIKRPDRKNAKSIITAARRDINFTLSLPPTKESGSTIARNIYECFRMLGDAILVAEGTEPIDHIEPLKRLMQLRVITKRPINLIDNLRRLRNNINYYGYTPSVEETEEAISIAKSCFEPLAKKIIANIEEKPQ